jgi:hypothetical protein
MKLGRFALQRLLPGLVTALIGESGRSCPILADRNSDLIGPASGATRSFAGNLGGCVSFRP